MKIGNHNSLPWDPPGLTEWLHTHLPPRLPLSSCSSLSLHHGLLLFINSRSSKFARVFQEKTSENCFCFLKLICFHADITFLLKK